jgi:hypothetical protein
LVTLSLGLVTLSFHGMLKPPLTVLRTMTSMVRGRLPAGTSSTHSCTCGTARRTWHMIPSNHMMAARANRPRDPP